MRGRTWGFDARGIWVEGGCPRRVPDQRLATAARTGVRTLELASTKKSITPANISACAGAKAIQNLPPGYNDRISSIKVMHGSGVTPLQRLQFWRAAWFYAEGHSESEGMAHCRRSFAHLERPMSQRFKFAENYAKK